MGIDNLDKIFHPNTVAVVGEDAVFDAAFKRAGAWISTLRDSADPQGQWTIS